MNTAQFRNLTKSEIELLEKNACTAEDWNLVTVADGFDPKYIRETDFSGYIRLGVFEKEMKLTGGVVKHTGIRRTVLKNVEIGDNCLIENVTNYIANYVIGHDTFIENVNVMFNDEDAVFGNGVEAAVLNETGGREVMIYDRLSAQIAYIMALYRHRPRMIAKLKDLISEYRDSVKSSVGKIGCHVMIVDTNYIRNVTIGDYCKIEGASRLKNGSVLGNINAPSVVGNDVIADNFIIQSGSSVRDGVTLFNCFVGQACELGSTYSASDSLFFSNCVGINGEACALFAGPYTVTHHKSTLLIAAMFSFMNAGSGSNQSNHMYKLGPLHQGIMERGSKTASGSYVLWPAKVGAFSLVMGRHTSHQNTSDLPFSYLIEDQGTTFIAPGANLHSVGTIRDVLKWPKRDARKDPDKLDCLNFNLLSPYTIRKMLNGIELLSNMQRVSGYTSEIYTFQSGKIRNRALVNGISYYRQAIDKFLGNSLVTKIQKSEFCNIEELRVCLKPTSDTGIGDWVDAGGMIAPKSCIVEILEDIESGKLSSIEEINSMFHNIHAKYYEYEWNWAYGIIEGFYKVKLDEISVDGLLALIGRWKESVIAMDNAYYSDASKEFNLNSMTGFGADGDEAQRREDFLQVRGEAFENNPFVKSILKHIEEKTALYEAVTSRLKSLLEVRA